MTTPNRPPLSPAAQKVRHAAYYLCPSGQAHRLEARIAAALRAAADQVECDMPEDSAYAAGYEQALADIFDIANELDPQT